MTFDLRKEVLLRINEVFRTYVDTKKLWVELSTEYPEDYPTVYSNWIYNNEKV